MDKEDKKRTFEQGKGIFGSDGHPFPSAHLRFCSRLDVRGRRLASFFVCAGGKRRGDDMSGRVSDEDTMDLYLESDRRRDD